VRVDARGITRSDRAICGAGLETRVVRLRTLGQSPGFDVSDVRYVRSGDAHVAYRVVQSSVAGARDVVLVSAGTMPMDALFEDPVALRLVEGLAVLGRLVMFDRSGIGLSDPPVDLERSVLERWCEDIEAVVIATQVAEPVLVTNALGASPVIVYCDKHADQVTSVVMLEPSYGSRVEPDLIRQQIEGELDSVGLLLPSRADEPGFRDWFNRAGQRGASPRLAVQAYLTGSDEDIRVVAESASRMRVPTLVLRRPGHQWSPPSSQDPVMAILPSAVRVDLPGEDVLIYGGEIDAFLAEVSRFVTGAYRIAEPERVLTAVLYSDLVASTARATVMGDAHWKRLLDRHDAVSRACVARRGGTVIKTTGDGILATIPSVTNALRVAQELRAALLEYGLEVRVGIHVGDVDRRGDDISGIAAVIAARVLALAAPGELLVTSAVVTSTTGENVHFEARGEHQLKGLPGTWPLFAITSPEPASRS
jgi:class 3 adenylate cyclase